MKSLLGLKLNRRVTLRGATVSTRDEWGQVVDTAPVDVEVWANVRFPTGAERLRADAPVASRRVSIAVRREVVVTPEMQAIVKGTVYDIQSADPDDSGRYRFIVGEAAG